MSGCRVSKFGWSNNPFQLLAYTSNTHRYNKVLSIDEMSQETEQPSAEKIVGYFNSALKELRVSFMLYVLVCAEILTPCPGDR